MAIRIDLLPRYVGLRRWFKRILLGCISTVGVFAAILFAVYYREQLKLQTLQQNRSTFEAVAQKAEKAAGDAEAKTKEAQPYRDTVAFFVDAGQTGAQRAALIDIVQRYIYREAVVNMMDISDGQTVKLSAMVRNPDEYANLLNILRRGTLPTGIAFKDLPSGVGIAGWPKSSGGGTQAGGQAAAPQPGAGAAGAAPAPAESQAEYQVFPNSITLQGSLREPITVPLPPGESAAVNAAQGALAPGANPAQ